VSAPLDPHGRVPAENLPIYAIRTHAEMTWQDLAAFLLGLFTPLSIVALCFGHYSYTEAKKIGLKQHAIGMIGMIFGAIGCAGWCLFWFFLTIGTAASGH